MQALRTFIICTAIVIEENYPANEPIFAIPSVQTWLPEQHPEVDVGRDDCGKGKWNADADKVAGLDLVAIFPENADAGDVGRSADRGAVAAQSGA